MAREISNPHVLNTKPQTQDPDPETKQLHPDPDPEARAGGPARAIGGMKFPPFFGQWLSKDWLA